MRIAKLLAAVALAAGLAACSAHDTPDSGVTACRMMVADKQAGTTPDHARSTDELYRLARSRNADLRHAAATISADDMNAAATAIDQLYAGCAAVGVQLN